MVTNIVSNASIKIDFWHEVKMQIVCKNDFHHNWTTLRYIPISLKKAQNPYGNASSLSGIPYI